jgi:hypothetical protein
MDIISMIWYYLYIVPICFCKCLIYSKYAKVYNFVRFNYNPGLLSLKVLQLCQIIEENKIDALAVIGGMYEPIQNICLFKKGQRIGICRVTKQSIGEFVKYEEKNYLGLKVYCGYLTIL